MQRLLQIVLDGGQAMNAFIGIDGLRKLATEHPEFDWLRHELEIDRIRCVVSRNGELFTGECTDQEAERKAQTSDVWRVHREKMTKTAAVRRAIESAFPEFIPEQ